MNGTDNIFGNMINNIEAKAAEVIPKNEGDYIVDGILYCYKCDTPKQCRIELFGAVRTPMCLCKCEAEKVERENKEFEQRQRFERIAKMRQMGFSEREMQKWNFAADDLSNPKITNIAHNYVENFPEMLKRGKGLLFFGSVGTGKSFVAACIANALIDKGYPCLMTNFSRLINTLNGMFAGRQDYIDSLRNYDLLIIDDLSAERNTEFMNTEVQNIIDNRYRSGLPTIITTNLTGEELKHPADISKQRSFSRLLEMCIPVEVEGKDRRKEKLKEDHNELKNILGL